MQERQLVCQHEKERARKPAFARFFGMQEVCVGHQTFPAPPGVHEGAYLRVDRTQGDIPTLEPDTLAVQPFAKLGKQFPNRAAFQPGVDQPGEQLFLLVRCRKMTATIIEIYAIQTHRTTR